MNEQTEFKIYLSLRGKLNEVQGTIGWIFGIVIFKFVSSKPVTIYPLVLLSIYTPFVILELYRGLPLLFGRPKYILSTKSFRANGSNLENAWSEIRSIKKYAHPNLISIHSAFPTSRPRDFLFSVLGPKWIREEWEELIPQSRIRTDLKVIAEHLALYSKVEREQNAPPEIARRLKQSLF